MAPTFMNLKDFLKKLIDRFRERYLTRKKVNDQEYYDLLTNRQKINQLGKNTEREKYKTSSENTHNSMGLTHPLRWQ